MNALELKFTADGHIAYKDPRNPHLRIWYPGCFRISTNVFGSVVTGIITDATDQPTRPLCRFVRASHW